MIVQLSARAKAELDAALAYLTAESPSAAERLARHMEAALISLTQMPNRGRPGVVDGTRELVVPKAPYVIVYVTLEDRVLVARIRHTSRDPSP
mgnify:CR=1 FL=1